MSIGSHIDFCSILGILLLATIAIITTKSSISAAAIATSHFDIGEITDIKVNVSLHDKRVPQLQVFWTDTLPTDVSYNVIVRPLNSTECPEMPCSDYGIGKPTESLLIPKQPMSYVEAMECNYMFGCNYTLTVETTNMHAMRNVSVQIPLCIDNVCSCRHADNLPKVTCTANVPNNDTIMLLWTINMTERDAIAAIKAMKIFLKIGEQTNPTLSWGGKHISIFETEYNISDLTLLETNSTLQGKIRIKLHKPLASTGVLLLHSHIIDLMQCAGPPSNQRIKVPNFNESKTALVEHDNHLRISLVIVSIFFICTLSAALIAGMVVCRRRSKSEHVHLPREGDYMSPLTMVEMEDNINYVDKDVEEAQAKGLADIFEVPHHAIQLGPEIGEGAFGRVYKAVAYNLRRMRGATLVAVKQLKKNPTADEVAEFLSEIEMLKAVGRHNNIVCFLGCATIRPPYMMIMEYVGRGDLLSYLRTVRYEISKRYPNSNTKANCNNLTSNIAPPPPPPSPPQVSLDAGATTVKYIELQMSAQSVDSELTDGQQPRQAMPSFAETTYTIIDDDEYREPEFLYVLNHKELHNFAMQIANGMRFLEDQQITHRDLAARNVLIDDCKTLKISDFGLSRHGIYTNTKTRKLPLRWLSIEAIRDNIYSSKSDVWAYGVVLWEIGTLGASPYPTISNHELIPFLMSGKRLDKPDICTDQVYALMMQCWDEDPMQRPSFEELYKALSPRTAYVDISNLSDDYVFPPIKDTDVTMR